MKCSSCQNENTIESGFCEYCGAMLEGAETNEDYGIDYSSIDFMPPPADKMGIASIVSALVCPPVGIFLGIKTIKKNKASRLGMIGLVISIIFCALYLFTIIVPLLNSALRNSNANNEIPSMYDTPYNVGRVDSPTDSDRNRAPIEVAPAWGVEEAAPPANVPQIEYVTIPNFTGLHVNEYADVLRDLGLFVVLHNEYSDNVPLHHVIMNDIAVNSHAEKGSTITVWVSLGAEKIIIPDYSHWDINSVVSDLERRGLTAQVLYNYGNASSMQNLTITTMPPNGSQVEKGDTITVTVDIPDFTGMNINDVTLLASVLGLNIIQESDFDYNIERNYILRTNVNTSRLERGSTVTVWVSQGGLFDYEPVSGGVRIIGYNGNETNINIPRTIGGLSVVEIGSGVFSYKEASSIVIPDSVTVIGNGAFMNCSNLKDITIPNSVTKIDGNAFSKTGLTSVVIPNSVIEIGNGAFSGCNNLTSVTLGNGITMINDNTFNGCTNLTSITIPNSVTEIGENAFTRSGLTSIVIPDSVTRIGKEAFGDCTSLTSAVIGNSVIVIGSGAFRNCMKLKSVVIPDNLTTLRHDVFSGTPELSSITYKSVTYNSYIDFVSAFRNMDGNRFI
jgi:beta-lactam-binding protein with PASTA domain